MPKYVTDYSEGDDDDVIEVPYVKPKPPMIVLSASEDEDENADSELILETIAKQSKSKTGSRSDGSRTKEQRDHDVLNRSPELSLKNIDTAIPMNKTSKKSRLAPSNKNKEKSASNLPNGEAIVSTDLVPEQAAEMCQHVEPGAEFVSLSHTHNDSGDSTTRSTKIVTNSVGSDISKSNVNKDTIGSEVDELTPPTHISFDSGFTPSNCSALGKDNAVGVQDVLTSSAVERTGVEPEQKGKKRARSANSTSRSPKRKQCAKSAQEQSRSDLLKFMQHLGLPLQELPAMDTPTRKRVPKKPKNMQAELPAPAAGSSVLSPSSELPVSNECRAFVSCTADGTTNGKDDVQGASHNRSRPPRKKTRSDVSEPLEDIMITQEDLDSINSKIQTNVVIPASVSRSSTEERSTQQPTKASKRTDEAQPGSSNKPLKRRRNLGTIAADKNELRQVGHPMSSTPDSNSREARNKNKTNKVKNIYPVKWDVKMQQFYGQIRDADVQMSDIQNKQHGHSSNWPAPEDTSNKRKRPLRRVRCENCNQMGHLKHECLDTMKPRICGVCGCEGHTSDDTRTPCPNGLCLNCGERQSRFQKACDKCVYQSRPIKCTLCDVVGHGDSLCPDLWRRYHSTTSMSAVDDHNLDVGGLRTEPKKKVYKPAFSVHCANCGVRGHNYYRCKVPRYSHSYPHKPYVIKELSNPIAIVPPVASVISEETPKKRKVTPVKQSTSVVESLTIEIENPVSRRERDSETENNNQILPEPDVSQTRTSPDYSEVNFEVKIEVVVTLNPAEHNILLRALDEKKTNELFKNNSEREVDIQIRRDQREVRLYGFEEGVDQARLDIFKLLFELKTTELRNKKEGIISQSASKMDHVQVVSSEGISTKENHSSKATFPTDGRQEIEMARNQEIGPRLNPLEPWSHQPPYERRIGNHVAASSTISFQEDDFPNMFDVDERVCGNQSIMQNMSVFHPRGPFSAPPIKEYIPIPIPVPVPLTEYASYTSGSATGQDFGTFDSRSFPLAFAKAYYKSSMEFPQLPQVRPTVFEPPDVNAGEQSPLDECSELVTASPRLQKEESPELEIIGELSGKDKSTEQMNNPKDVLSMTLLASEWQFISVDKTELLPKLSKNLQVNISVDMKTMIISIRGGSKKKRKLAQENILGFIQAKKAGIPYKLQLVSDVTENLVDQSSNPEKSESISQERYPSGDAIPTQDEFHTPSKFSVRSHSQGRQGETGHHRRNATNNSNFHNYQEYGARRGVEENSKFQSYRHRNYRHPYNNYRNYHSNEGSERRYERNNYRPHSSGRARGSRPSRPTRYFDATS